MTNFDELKQKAIDAAAVLADKSIEFGKTAAEKAKVIARIVKLTAEIATEKETVKKNYQEIGRIYYENHQNNVDPELVQLVSDISVSLETINSKSQEIADLKAEEPEAAEEAEIIIEETIVVEDAQPCEECCSDSETQE